MNVEIPNANALAGAE